VRHVCKIDCQFHLCGDARAHIEAPALAPAAAPAIAPVEAPASAETPSSTSIMAPTPAPGDATALAKVRGPIEGPLVGGILLWLTTKRCSLRASVLQGAALAVSVRGRGRGRGERGLPVSRTASPWRSGHSKSRRRRGDSTAFATRENAQQKDAWHTLIN